MGFACFYQLARQVLDYNHLKGDIRLLAQCFVQGKVLEMIEFAEVYHVHYHLMIIPLLGAVVFFHFCDVAWVAIIPQ
jgi:hypothetical protein